MTLFVYDHCPYCIKARMIFGYKKINFKMETLLNDDEETPIKMIGQKMLPILKKEDGTFMPESLDIIDYIDSNFSPSFLHSSEQDLFLNQWLQNSRSYLYALAMPRWVQVGLEEFKTQAAVDYFTRKKEDYIGPFEDHLQKTKHYIELANDHLMTLENKMTTSAFYLSERATLNDIHLYAILRCLSITKNIYFPEKILTYMKRQEELTQVPLHFNIAI